MKKKIFSVSNSENFEIKVLERNVFTYTDHYFLRFGQDVTHICGDCSLYHMEQITWDNLSDCALEGLGQRRAEKLLCKPELFQGYLLYDSEDHPVAYIWTARRGANELQYRVRKIDVLLFGLIVFPEYRGRGIAGTFFSLLLMHLYSLGIDGMYCGVRTNNASALRAYDKLGFEILSRKRFIRILKCNIPYHKV